MAKETDRKWWSGLGLVAFLCLMILVYSLVLLKFARIFLAQHSWTGTVMAVGIAIVPLLGIWIIYSTLRAGFAHQHLAAQARAQGVDLTTEGLRRRPSGRLVREDADQLFATIKAEWEQDPDSWITNFRLARAYDYAGDRPRAREVMRRAVALEKAASNS